MHSLSDVEYAYQISTGNALLVSDLNWRESELKGVFDFNRLLRVIIAIGLAASSFT
jgi:hypothetical protein